MPQSITLNPTLKTLLPEFRARCAAIRKALCDCAKVAITVDVLRELRATHLAPLDSPNKVEQDEELKLLAVLSVLLDLTVQGWRMIATEPAVVLEFENGTS